MVNSTDHKDGNYFLTPEHIKEITTALSDHNDVLVQELIASMHVADIADLLGIISHEDRERLIAVIHKNFNPEVLVDLEPEVREEILSLLGLEETVAAITKLDSEDALHVIEDLGEAEQQEILQAIPEEQRSQVEQGLSYPEGSVGRLIHSHFVAVPQFWTVGQTIDYMRSQEEDLPDYFYEIYIMDPKFTPIGSVSVSKVLRTFREVEIKEIMNEEIRTIEAEMDQEEVAYIFRRYGLASAPVVGDDRRLIGTVFMDDMIEVIDEEAEEDIMRMGGVYEDDFHSALINTTKRRFPWLLVNLFTAIIASVVIGMFEGTIENLVALAVLMPIIASMGGNAGTQTLTIAVRALATKELTVTNAARVILKETVVGGMNGILFAIITLIVVTLWYQVIVLSAVFAVAMIMTLIFAGFFGAVIPLLLSRMRVDPAIASGVFLTTVTDVVAFAAFLGLAAYILL
ncbi:MAG: magnesium transporter [Rickettsiales bacterium]|nr:magnesium transporter [Rickettsiales bacterium]